MKYLDENIIITLTFDTATYGPANLTVAMGDSTNSVFLGRVYVPASANGSYDVDITDICAACRWNNNLVTITQQNISQVSAEGWIETFYVSMTFDSGGSASASEEVSLWWRNPETLAVPSAAILLQPGLTPHAPLIRTSKNLFANLASVSSGVKYEIYDGTMIPVNAVDGSPMRGYILDACPARYYLKWTDRAGSVQEQPMSGKRVFSEAISRETIETSTGKRRDVSWQVTAKWELNTGFISEDVMPNYESILVSQYLVLYDTQEDRLYPVICTDNSYTHKTYKNDKMFSMTLHLELDKRQTLTN